MFKISIYFLLFFSLFTLSCNKVEKTTATILVRDESKKPIAGASVTLSANTTDSKMKVDTSYVDIHLVSGADGKVTYDYSSIYKLGQAGGAVMDIYAIKVVDSDTLEGKSHVIVTPEKNNEAIVTIVKKIPQN